MYVYCEVVAITLFSVLLLQARCPVHHYNPVIKPLQMPWGQPPRRLSISCPAVSQPLSLTRSSGAHDRVSSVLGFACRQRKIMALSGGTGIRAAVHQRSISTQHLDSPIPSIDANQPLLSPESPQRESLEHPGSRYRSQPEVSGRSKTQLDDIRLSIDSDQSVTQLGISALRLDHNAQLQGQADSTGRAQPVTQTHTFGESESEKDRQRTSFELRSWAREQSKKQPQNPSVSGIKNSLELQASGRNRSMDLLRADTQNIRLSIESARLPKGEKMRCIISDGPMSKVVSSQDAFGMIATGVQCVITGFAFEHMIKVSQLPIAISNTEPVYTDVASCEVACRTSTTE